MTDQSRILVCSKFLAAAVELSGVEQLGCAYFKTFFKKMLSQLSGIFIKCRNTEENELPSKMVKKILVSGYFSPLCSNSKHNIQTWLLICTAFESWPLEENC